MAGPDRGNFMIGVFVKITGETGRPERAVPETAESGPEVGTFAFWVTSRMRENPFIEGEGLPVRGRAPERPA